MSRVVYNNRLVNSIVPTEYDLWLMPDFKSFDFQGRVKIYVNFLESHSNVILHSKNLKINDVIFNHKSIDKSLYIVDESNEIIDIDLIDNYTGNHLLEIFYQGTLHP